MRIELRCEIDAHEYGITVESDATVGTLGAIQVAVNAMRQMIAIAYEMMDEEK